MTSGAAGPSSMDQNLSTRDLLHGLDYSAPNTTATQSLLNMILHRRQQAAKKEEDRAKKRQELQDQLAAKADDLAAAAANADALEETMEKMKEQLGLGARVEELEEYEQVVHHVTQTSLDEKLAATASTPEDYLKKAAAARSALGIPISASTTETSLTGDAGISWEFEAFSQAVRSGLIYAQLSSGKVCNAQYTDALFKLIAYCTDGAVAGAAFATLAAMLGYELEKGTVSLDPTFTSLVLSSKNKNKKSSSSSISVEGLPSDEDLLEAFAANGYKVPDARKKPQGKEKVKGKGKGKGKAAEDDADDDEAAAAGGNKKKKGGDNKDVPQLRIQTLKLLLHTVAAISLHHPTSTTTTWSREGLSDLLLLSIRMQLDPEAIRLQDDSDAAIRAVLNVFEDSDWNMKLQQLANKLVLVGPGNWCRLRLLRSIPVKNHARAFALQQFTGCVLLDKIIPPKGGGTGGTKSLTGRGGAADMDPMKVISSSQPWFSDPKKLVEMGTSGGSGAPPRDGYLIEEVELLLRICHVLLWPHVVKKYSPIPPPPSSSSGGNNNEKLEENDGVKEGLLTGEFMTAWDTFLGVILRNIKAMQVEDQAVKAFANWCQLEYKERSQGGDYMINSEEEEEDSEEEEEEEDDE